MSNIKLFFYLQKNLGLARRDLMQLIKNHQILLNDKLVEDIQQLIQIGDKLEITASQYKLSEKIKYLPKFKTKIIVFNKPKGYIVSKDKSQGKTIYDLLPTSWLKDFYYIGRLDKFSHGLLLLTNQPKLVDEFENPTNKIKKIYLVQIDNILRSNDIKKLKYGIMVDAQGMLVHKDPNALIPKGSGIDLLQFYNLRLVPSKSKKNLYEIVLFEGKKRHIRRMFTALNYKILDLQRVKFGKYELGDIKLGKYRIYDV